MANEAVDVAVEPRAGVEHLVAAVERGGGRVVGVADAAALVWSRPDGPQALAEVLGANPHLEWVQLPFAGVEPYVELIQAYDHLSWTCGKGVYAEPVAEHALGLALAGMRCLGEYARAQRWTGAKGHNLLGARVAILGGGGIAESLLRLLGPFGCDVTVVRRTARPLAGADRVVTSDHLDEALAGADLVVLALPLVEETVGVMDARRMALMAPGSCLVNVARGRHIVTDDLVQALRAGVLGSAGLDVTDPEPLPEGHPLWSMEQVVITPHIGNTPEMAVPLLSRRVEENVRRWRMGEELLGPVDPVAGY